ncbi:MAG: cyanophycin synthetase [bacterium]|nr:cyanophycin synthetase [bacterium]
MNKPVNLNDIKKIYMVGIKGTGMASLGVNLKNMGIKVSGSDSPEVFFTDQLLRRHGIKVFSPFNKDNIPADVDLVVASTAYNNKNSEFKEVEMRGIPLMTYPEVIGLLSREMKSVAVCGSHGKTTTSALLAYILSKSKMGVLPNVGSIVPQLVNYKMKGRPGVFMYEADEYQNKLKLYSADVVILTNVDYDHPDFFKTEKEYKKVFRDFIKRIPVGGLLIYCAGDKEAVRIAKYAKCRKIGYDTKESQEYPAQLIGAHNRLNLSAAIVCAREFGVLHGIIKKAVVDFRGVKRRLEIIKKTRLNGNECLLIDDYGHHPAEIKATISAIKEAYPKKMLWTVFQPHTFSRTEALFDDFTKCFSGSDKTVILDIYASARENRGTIHSRDLVNKINSSGVAYQPGIKEVARFLKQKIKTPSIIMTIGASNVWRLHELL